MDADLVYLAKLSKSKRKIKTNLLISPQKRIFYQKKKFLILTRASHLAKPREKNVHCLRKSIDSF